MVSPHPRAVPFSRNFRPGLTNHRYPRVREAAEGDSFLPGQALIAPGGYHMTLTHGFPDAKVGLNQSPPENSCRPAADVLFRSVAEHYGPAALVAVLTGMGQDGLRGCEAIREAGGSIIAQDEATSVVWGMPGAAANAGVCSAVLPLGELGPKIVRLFRGDKS